MHARPIVLLIVLTASLVHAQFRYPPRKVDPLELFQGERLVSSPALANTHSSDADLDSFIVKTMDEYHMAGLAALIVVDTQVVWRGNYGYANITENKEVTDSTLFMLASLSKTITATALMQLWEQGMFELDDNINDYLPPEMQVVNLSYPDDSISFSMLLTHTSSINDNWSIMTPLIVTGDSPIPLDSFLVNYLIPGGVYYRAASFNGSKPGTLHDYSNIGFALIAYLVERVSGQPFPEYCQENIFDPLGMTSTSWFLSGLDTSDISLPYQWSGSSFFTEGHHGYPDYPDGQLRTTTLELANFMISYMNDGIFDGQSLLEASTIDTMFIKREYYADHPWWYGFGWMSRSKHGGGWLWGHGGHDKGSRTDLEISIENNWGVLVFSNTSTWSKDASYHGVDVVMSELVQYADSVATLAITAERILPNYFALRQNYPNPFNPVSHIRYELPAGADVRITVFDLRGREISTLVNRYKQAGSYEVQFNGQGLASGIYIARLVTPEFTKSIKMVLLK